MIEALLTRMREFSIDSPTDPHELFQNEQEQQYEVEALQSIYGDEFRVLESIAIDGSFKESCNALPTVFMVSVCCDLEHPLKVTATCKVPGPSSGLPQAAVISATSGPESPCGSLASQACEAGSTREPRTNAAASISFFVRSLPPISLLLALPPSYPSRSPPFFSLTSPFLSPSQTAELAGQLLSIWESQAGQVVVFPWADFLAREALSLLGIESELVLRDQEQRGAAAAAAAAAAVSPVSASRIVASGRGTPAAAAASPDGSAFAGHDEPADGSSGREECGGGDSEDSGLHWKKCFVGQVSPGQQLTNSVPLEERVRRLMSWDERKRREEFLQAFHKCGVCLEELAGSSFVVEKCGHFFCRPCLSSFSACHVKEGSVALLACPHTSCKQPLGHATLKDLLPPPLFDRWEQLTLQRTLDTMSDLAYCPRCQMVCVEDPRDNHAQCPRCFFSFCAICYDSWHGGRQCLTPEARIRVLERRNRDRSQGEEQARREKDMLQELQSLKLVCEQTKQCPCCKMAISKTEGCNKMVCGNCDTKFCYKCRATITGYEHYRDGQCELFDEEAIQAWERQVANVRHPQFLAGMGQAGLQQHVDLWVANVKRCPNCKQESVKVRRVSAAHPSFNPTFPCDDGRFLW